MATQWLLCYKTAASWCQRSLRRFMQLLNSGKYPSIRLNATQQSKRGSPVGTYCGHVKIYRSAIKTPGCGTAHSTSQRQADSFRLPGPSTHARHLQQLAPGRPDMGDSLLRAFSNLLDRSPCHASNCVALWLLLACEPRCARFR